MERQLKGCLKVHKLERPKRAGALSGLLQLLWAADGNGREGSQRPNVNGVLLWGLDHLERSEAILVRPREHGVRPRASWGWGTQGLEVGRRELSGFLDLAPRESFYLGRKLLDDALLLRTEPCRLTNAMRSDLGCESLLRLLPEDRGLRLRLLPEHRGLWLRLPEYWSLTCLLPKHWSLAGLLPEDWCLGNRSGLPLYWLRLLGRSYSSKGLVA